MLRCIADSESAAGAAPQEAELWPLRLAPSEPPALPKGIAGERQNLLLLETDLKSGFCAKE